MQEMHKHALRHTWRHMAALMMGGFLGGCATVAQVTDLTVLPAAAAEYAAAGSSRYTVIRGDFRGPSGC